MVCLSQERVEEVEALQACFPDLLTLAPAEADALLFAKHVCQAGSSAAAPADVPALSGLLRLPDVEIGGSPVLLKFVLPRLGGGDGVPSLQVISNAPRQDADSLQQLASEVVEECARDGTLCLLLAADRLASAARDIAAGERQQAAAQQPSCAGAAAQQQQQRSSEQGLVLSRCCIWCAGLMPP